MSVIFYKNHSKISNVRIFTFAVGVVTLLLFPSSRVLSSSQTSELLLSQRANVEYVCKTIKIRISQEEYGQIRLMVDVKRNPTNIFWNGFDVTRDATGSIVRTRNIELAPGDNPTGADIRETFDFYYSLYQNNQCI